MVLAQPQLGGQLSPASLSEAGTTAGVSPELSPPPSPQLQSTAREQPRYHPARLWPGRRDVVTFILTVLNINAVVFAAVPFSPSRPQPGFSSSGSSPQPEKISLEDLTGFMKLHKHVGVQFSDQCY